MAAAGISTEDFQKFAQVTFFLQATYNLIQLGVVRWGAGICGAQAYIPVAYIHNGSLTQSLLPQRVVSLV